MTSRLWPHLPSLARRGRAQFYFGAAGRIVSVGAVPASQFRCGPSGGQMKVGACRDRAVATAGAAALERLVAGEDVPGGDQHLARDGGLAGVGLALPRGDVARKV